MKKLIVFLIFLFAIPAYGQVELARMSPAMVGGGVAAAGGGPNVYYYSGNNPPTNVGHTAGANVARGSKVTCTEAGNITKLGAHLGHDTETAVKIALYDEAGTTLLSSGGTITGLGAQGWVDVTLGTPVAVTAGQVVWVAADGDASYLDGYDSSGEPRIYPNVAYADFPSATLNLVGSEAGPWGYRVYVD